MKPSVSRGLVIYSVAVTTAVLATAVIATVGASALDDRTPARFGEIDVRRINVREADGRLRLIVSNTSHFPGLVFRGKDHPHPNRKTTGVLFFNDEQTENGGLLFHGRTDKDGKVTGGGHLSFDQYEQDQVIQLAHSEYGGKRWAGLVFHDYQDGPMDLDAWEKAEAMPAGEAKDTEIKRLGERYGPKRRLFLGKTRDRNSDIGLFDAAGKVRLRLRVTPDGAPSIEFLDDSGKVVRTIDQSAQPAG